MENKIERKNPVLKQLIKDLKKQSIEKDVNIWKRVAEDLEKPTKKQRSINLYKLNDVVNEGDTVVVPGKVLGTGHITTEITLAAYNYSNSAREKAEDSPVEVMTIRELVEENPEGKNVRIIG